MELELRGNYEMAGYLSFEDGRVRGSVIKVVFFLVEAGKHCTPQLI